MRLFSQYYVLVLFIIGFLLSGIVRLDAEDRTLLLPQWKSIGNTQFHHIDCNTAIIQTHQVLVVGGYQQDISGILIPLKSCEVIDLKSGNVQEALQMSIPHAEAALVQNGDSNLVIIGGISTGNKATAICEYYDRFYRSWRQVGKLITPRVKPLATFISNEEILVCGGKDANGRPLTSCEILNIKSGKSKMVAPLPSIVQNALCFISTLFQFPKPVVIASECGNSGTCRVYVYDEKQDRWSVKNSIIPSLNKLQWIRLYDQRTVLWGNSPQSLTVDTMSNVFIENFTGYRIIAEKPILRSDYSVIQWNNDTLLVAGGYNQQGIYDSTSVWIDMLSGKHSVGPSIHFSRRGATLVSLPFFDDSGCLLEKCAVMFGGINLNNQYETNIEVLREIVPSPRTPIEEEALLWGKFPSVLTIPVVLALTAGVVGCLVLALLYLVQTLRLQLLREQEYLRTTQEKESLTAQIVTLRLQTLQLQMKPHFVYNSLAAVESLVLFNQTKQAAYYIRVLAKLFRIVLEHSDHSTVKIHDAIEFLKVYIALEQLRMDYTFDYDITHTLSTSEIQLYIPSMLVQPYIENSVKYGLGLLQDFNAMNPEKKRQGKLALDFAMTKFEGKEFLRCMVEDNGVGRDKAKEVFAKRTTYEGLSRSTRVNEERLSLLTKLQLQVRNVHYEDLFDEYGFPNGTRVVLLIPVFAQQSHEQSMNQ